jgi:hypothetical protein
MSASGGHAQAAACYARILGLLTADEPDQEAVDAEVAAAETALAEAVVETESDRAAAVEADRLRQLALAAANEHRERLRAAMLAPAASPSQAALRAYAGGDDGTTEARFLDQHT